MKPKDYYENNPPEPNGQKFVLGLFPEKSSHLFENLIRGIIEKDDSELIYKSYLDDNKFKNSSIIESILDNIQNASLIITDVSGYVPNVMYELGIAFVKNENHILICDEESIQKPPFYLSNIPIQEYSDQNKAALEKFIKSQVERINPESPHVCSFSLDSMHTVQQIKVLSEENRETSYESALILISRLKEKEPDNVCVDELHAEILVKANRLDGAIKVYNDILTNSKPTKSCSSLILMNIANCYLKFREQRIDEALKYFSKAESHYDKDPLLYKNWAHAFDLGLNYQGAVEKIYKARTLSSNDIEILRLCQYYTTKELGPLIDIGERPKNLPTNPIDQNRQNYNEFKRQVRLNDTIQGVVSGLFENGVQFNSRGVIGFVHVRFIEQTNFKALFKEGDEVTITLTGFKDDRCSIFGKNIQKINTL